MNRCALELDVRVEPLDTLLHSDGEHLRVGSESFLNLEHMIVDDISLGGAGDGVMMLHGCQSLLELDDGRFPDRLKFNLRK